MSNEMVAVIDSNRHIRTSRAEWIREAVISRLIEHHDGDWDGVPADSLAELPDDLREGLFDDDARALA
jgi:hypothetical protein